MSLDWLDDASCAQTDPEAFNPEKGGSARRAKAICAMCDVEAECLAYALANHPLPGVYGRTTERERRAMKRDAA